MALNISATSTLDSGVLERRFTVDGANGLVPGVLWTPSTPGPWPLVLLGHGGSGSKDSAGGRDRDWFAARGIATAAIDGPAHGDRGPVTNTTDPAYTEMWTRPRVIDDMNTDWNNTLDALLALGEFEASAVGYHGMSMGTMFGLPYVASEPRIVAAVLGMCALRGTSIDRSHIEGRLALDAGNVTCPLIFHVQWDDERFDRQSAFELYAMLGSTDKRLQATPGLHGGISVEGRETVREFLAGRLLAKVAQPV